MCVYVDGLYGFDSDKYCIKFFFEYSLVPGSPSYIWLLLLEMYIHDPVVFPSICRSGFLKGGINDPSMYMHCCE